MEKMDTLSEYKKFCEDCCNRIFQIRQEYERKRVVLRNDYESGRVTEEEYYRLMLVSIDEFVDSKYTLTQDDVAFIRTYAHLNRSGELMADLLKPSFLEQLHLLEGIYQSVQVYIQYGMLSLEDRKKQFREEVLRSYKPTIASFFSKLNVIKRTYGTRYKETEQYQEYATSFAALQKEMETKSHTIAVSTEEELNAYIGQFFSVDYRYYDWFKQMSLKEEYASGFLFKEHVSVAKKVVSATDDVSSLSQKKDGLEKELSEIVQSFSSFSEGMLQFDSSVYAAKYKIPFLKLMETKVDLSSVFHSLSAIPGALPYVRTFEVEKDKEASLSTCYANYIQLVYSGNVEQVDASSFIRTFMRNVLQYYQKRMDTLGNEIVKVQTVLEKQLQVLSATSQRNAHQAELQHAMVTELGKTDKVHLEDFGLTEEGISRIYSDLKDIAYKEYGFSLSVPSSLKK